MITLDYRSRKKCEDDYWKFTNEGRNVKSFVIKNLDCEYVRVSSGSYLRYRDVFQLEIEEKKEDEE